MKVIEDVEHSNRRSFAALAQLLSVGPYTVADYRVIPLSLVSGLADFLDVQPEYGTAEEMLAQVLSDSGLTSPSGIPLRFVPGDSAMITPALVRLVRERQKDTEKTIRCRTMVRFASLGGDFVPPKNKLEAVNRISLLTHSGPEVLGPGSKERKSVLQNLYSGLGFGTPPELSKIELGSKLAERLGVPWDQSCYSSGYTITLTGLERLLSAAEPRLSHTNTPSLTDETDMYAASIIGQAAKDVHESPREELMWDGQACVIEMLSSSYSNARQIEWPAFYYEFKAIPRLMRDFGGGPAKMGTTSFDYKGIRLWDLKAHSMTSPDGRVQAVAPLNDMASMDLAFEDGGLGFMVLKGIPSWDGEPGFYEWHRATVRGKEWAPRPKKSRRLKTSFRPVQIDFFFLPSAAVVNDLKNDKILTVFNQGKQADGSPRKAKYSLNLAKATVSNVFVKSYRFDDYINMSE